MKRFDAVLLILTITGLLAVSVFQQVKIEKLQESYEVLYTGCALHRGGIVQRLNIMENGFDLRLGFLEAGKVRPSVR